MAKIRCGDCNTVFDSNLPSCPTCGCPASACPIEPEQPHTTQNSNMNSDSSPISKTPDNDFHQSSPPVEEKRKIHPFEITCSVLAAIFVVLWVTTSLGGYADFDGSNLALRHEIAAIGFLIVGRLTAILNKLNAI